MASRFTSHKIIYDTLVPIAQQRLDEQAQAKLGHKIPEHVCIHAFALYMTRTFRKQWY
jgi:hypothetical protein